MVTSNNRIPTISGAKKEKEMTTDEMQKLYRVISFAAPFIIVERISDGVKGTLEFEHSPRRYFDFKETK